MKFKVGEIYRNRAGEEYEFIAHVPRAARWAQAIFMHVRDDDLHTRYVDGTCDPDTKHIYDILLPEKKTIKLYPALLKDKEGQLRITYELYSVCPTYAIRLATEYPAVIIEVES